MFYLDRILIFVELATSNPQSATTAEGWRGFLIRGVTYQEFPYNAVIWRQIRWLCNSNGCLSIVCSCCGMFVSVPTYIRSSLRQDYCSHLIVMILTHLQYLLLTICPLCVCLYEYCRHTTCGALELTNQPHCASWFVHVCSCTCVDSVMGVQVSSAE